MQCQKKDDISPVFFLHLFLAIHPVFVKFSRFQVFFWFSITFFWKPRRCTHVQSSRYWRITFSLFRIESSCFWIFCTFYDSEASSDCYTIFPVSYYYNAQRGNFLFLLDSDVSKLQVTPLSAFLADDREILFYPKDPRILRTWQEIEYASVKMHTPTRTRIHMQLRICTQRYTCTHTCTYINMHAHTYRM